VKGSGSCESRLNFRFHTKRNYSHKCGGNGRADVLLGCTMMRTQHLPLFTARPALTAIVRCLVTIVLVHKLTAHTGVEVARVAPKCAKCKRVRGVQ
jgi:hypothetical protein